MHAKAISGRAFFRAWLALMALTVTSFALSYAKLGMAETPVAIGIAVVKGLVVAAVFMELVEQRYTHKVTLVVGAAMLVLLASLLSVDVLTRGTPPLLPTAPPHEPAGR